MKVRLIIFLFLRSFFAQAQIQCVVENDQPILHPANVGGNRQELYEIPVLFHVFYGTNVLPVNPVTLKSVLDTANRMLLAQYSGMEAIVPEFQNVFASSKVQLRLAHLLPDGSCTSGMIYHPHDFSQSSPNIASVTIQTSHYLNIIVTSGSNSYATFPGPADFLNDPNDRIVFISPNAQNSPETLVHELGHWLGLRHTFGLTNETGGDCGDDFVADTPPTRGFGTCELNRMDCTAGVVENAQNFMDYSPCGLMLTQGQVDRMEGFLNDTNFNRTLIWQAENLEATGINLNPDCPVEVNFSHQMFPNCDSSQVRLSFALNGMIPDSVKWEIPVLNFNSNAPFLTFYSPVEGTLNIVFKYYKLGIEYSSNYSVNVQLNQINSAYPPAELPMVLDPDETVIFPNPNIQLINNTSDQGWQVCNFAGFQSNQCLYVPARTVIENTTTDLELGRFNFSTLSTPTLSFKVAAAMVPTGSFHFLEILFRDECSSAFVGNLWMSTPLNELFDGKTTSGFIPQNDSDWFHVEVPFPSWIISQNGIVTLRLRTAAMGAGFSGEPFYLDEFRIGDPEIVTQTNDVDQNTYWIYPNPAQHEFTIQSNSNQVDSPFEYKLFSVEGKLLQSGLQPAGMPISVSHLASGIYFVKLNNQATKFVKLD